MAFSTSQGRMILGKLRFTLKNKQYFDIAVSAFNKYSKYKGIVDYVNYFVQALEITSSLEAGFDGINTYDNAGISVGFIQFARPNVNVHKLLSLFNPVLAKKVKDAFGTADPYDDAKSMKSRKDDALILEVRNAISTPAGIEAQFKIAIEDYYDRSFAKFLTLKFSDEVETNPLKTGVKTPTDKNNYKIYANAFMFDICVNRGPGSLKDIKQITTGGIDMTEGDFLNWHANNIKLRPERREYWKGVVSDKFKGVPKK